jgi:hypothetical protein
VPRSEVITYRGIRFRRYPDATQLSDQRYFRPGQADAQRGVESLHREIWKDTHGPIPDGWHVHHIDHDASNNDPANLTCVPADEHRAHHGSDPARMEVYLRNIEIARPFAAIWHGSVEGRAWHSVHGAQTWEGREVRDETCEQCGAVYQTRKPSRFRFCSNNCKSQHRRLSGVDDETRTCPICGGEFVAGKYTVKVACSRACGQRLRARRQQDVLF